MIKVTIWNEFRHEKTNELAKANYPQGIHGLIKEFLEKDEEITCRLACLDDENCGLTQEIIDNTDVLIWWGHMFHQEVPDEIAEMVVKAVQNGMGFIGLHSAHHSKPFIKLMGTPCHLGWRENGDLERVWTVAPAHPIAQGIGRYFELEHEEVYSEPFSVPEPDELVFAGWFEGGELFRSGCCYKRGYGNIFYFQPGHETYKSFYNENVQKVILNAVHWAKPIVRKEIDCPHIPQINGAN